MRRRQTLAALIAAALCTTPSSTRPLLACSWGVPSPIFSNAVFPSDLEAYARELGIVHPTYARRHLVEAYRRFSGRAIERAADDSPARDGSENEGVRAWLTEREAIVKTGRVPAPYTINTYRSVAQFESFLNCPNEAFAAATSTLQARARRFGPASAEVAEWLRGQDAVFENCGATGDAVLPAAITARVDPAIAADRAYQTAAAYFYATDYAKAEASFRAIAADRGSPWRMWGRYLAVRAMIRHATVTATEQEAGDLLSRAEAELKAIAGDAAADAPRAAATRLLGFVAAKARPLERLHEIAARLARAPSIAEQDLVDYTALMDRIVGNTVDYAYASVPNRSDLTRDDDLTDWILATQGTGDDAFAHALEQWTRTHTTPWLIAVLWRIPIQHADTPAVLTAAAAIPRESPAFATAAFLRVRLIAARGDRDEARRLLATLPGGPAPGFSAEAINLVRAERFMLAASFEDLLRNLTRTPVAAGQSFGMLEPDPVLDGTFDRDGELVLGERLPLARLLEAASSSILPQKLRTSIAAAVLTRAIMLRRDDTGLAAAALLRTLEPGAAAAFAAYVNATEADARHQAGILLLVRSPRLEPYAVPGADATTFTSREIVHAGDNWWCSPAPATSGVSGMYRSFPVTELPDVVSFRKTADFPEFLTPAERADATAELRALAALGTAPNYLASESVAWATARPQDTRAAEALARAVEGTRWGCTDATTGAASRRAFQTLHRLFPNSTWAKQTKYWYSGR